MSYEKLGIKILSLLPSSSGFPISLQLFKQEGCFAHFSISTICTYILMIKTLIECLGERTLDLVIDLGSGTGVPGKFIFEIIYQIFDPFCDFANVKIEPNFEEYENSPLKIAPNYETLHDFIEDMDNKKISLSDLNMCLAIIWPPLQHENNGFDIRAIEELEPSFIFLVISSLENISGSGELIDLVFNIYKTQPLKYFGTKNDVTYTLRYSEIDMCFGTFFLLYEKIQYN